MSWSTQESLEDISWTFLVALNQRFKTSYPKKFNFLVGSAQKKLSFKSSWVLILSSFLILSRNRGVIDRTRTEAFVWDCVVGLLLEMRPFCLVLVVCCWVMPNVAETIQGNIDTLFLTLVRVWSRLYAPHVILLICFVATSLSGIYYSVALDFIA